MLKEKETERFKLNTRLSRLDEQRTPDRQTHSVVNTRRNVRLRSAAFQQATLKCDHQSLPVTAIITRKIHHNCQWL